MNSLGGSIRNGSKSFFTSHLKYLSLIVFITYVLLLVFYSIETPSNDLTDGVRIGGCFIAGAMVAAAISSIGVAVSTDANVRTAQAAESGGASYALRVAFTAGSVHSFSATGVSLLGLSIMYCIMTLGRPADLFTMGEGADLAVEALVGFGLGFSVVAMFGRFRASIFAKAADIGAAVAENEDCGTVNPAAIAANVGVHVGDVGANGADLLETHVLSIIAAATIASGDMAMIALPFWLAGAGVIASAIAFFFVKAEDGASKDGILYALYKGKMISSVLFVALSAIIVSIFFDNLGKGWAILCCIIIGQVFGMFVSQLTEIFTSNSFLVKSIRDTDTIGPAVLIMRAVAFGLFSCIGPAVFIVVSLLATM